MIKFLSSFYQLSIVYNSDNSNVVTSDSIFVLIQWMMKLGPHKDCIFPLLDILRLAIKNFSVNTILCADDKGMDFMRPIIRYLMTEKPIAVPLLALRTICNMFAHDAGNVARSAED